MMIETLTMVMMDSVSVDTSCSPRRAMSSTQLSVTQWAAVTWDKTGFRLCFCVHVYIHQPVRVEKSGAAAWVTGA